MDYYGPGVSRAALMAALVGPGRIMVDPTVYAKAIQTMKNLDPFAIQSLGAVTLRKDLAPVDVYEVCLFLRDEMLLSK
jgi:class 3 adenylate cyclase